LIAVSFSLITRKRILGIGIVSPGRKGGKTMLLRYMNPETMRMVDVELTGPVEVVYQNLPGTTADSGEVVVRFYDGGPEDGMSVSKFRDKEDDTPEELVYSIEEVEALARG
jgi:hypothetical protein